MTLIQLNKRLLALIPVLLLCMFARAQDTPYVQHFPRSNAQAIDSFRGSVEIDKDFYLGKYPATRGQYVLTPGWRGLVDTIATGDLITPGVGLLKSGDTIFVDTSYVVSRSLLDSQLDTKVGRSDVSYANGYLSLGGGSGEAVSNVLILSGQSNALGQFPDTAMNYFPEEYEGVQNMLKVWWTGDWDSPAPGHFESMHVPLNTRDKVYTNPSSIPNYYITGWGVEQSAGHKLQDAFNDTLYVLKSTLGATNINYWTAPGGSEWVKLSSYITGSAAYLDAIGKPVNFRAFIWLQGESDALENIEALYEGRLRTFIANWRALDSRLDSTLFVMVKLRAGTISQSKVDVINAAFEQMAEESPFNIVVDPIAVGATLFDGLHYGVNMLQLGDAIADTILARTTDPYLVNIGTGLDVTDGNGFDLTVDNSEIVPNLSIGLQSGYSLLNNTTQTIAGAKTFTSPVVISGSGELLTVNGVTRLTPGTNASALWSSTGVYTQRTSSTQEIMSDFGITGDATRNIRVFLANGASGQLPFGHTGIVMGTSLSGTFSSSILYNGSSTFFTHGTVSQPWRFSNGFIQGGSAVGGMYLRLGTPYATITSTSGTISAVVLNYDDVGVYGFKPTSGTAAFNAVHIPVQINQGGSANGITRALRITPTELVATDFRAIEVADIGAHTGLHITAAKNYLSGSLGIGGAVGADRLTVYGNLNLPTAGNKIKIATGSNASIGTATLVAGTVTVNTTAVTATSKIFVTVVTPGGTQGFLSVPTITAGTSFVINSSSATETSTVNWWIIN